MNRRRLLCAAGATAALWSAAALGSALASAAEPPNLIERLLRADERFAPFLADPERYRLQVVLGVVEEDGEGRPRLTQHAYRAGAEYFYPASSVKLCAAVAALEELARLRETTGLPIDETTPLAYHPLFEDEELERADPSDLEGGRITVGHEIRKLFLVSDNVAFNRLYELLGPARLNRSMRRAGLGSTRIVHRLAEFRSVEDNRRTPRIELAGATFRHVIPERTDALDLGAPAVAGLDVGEGYLRAGEKIRGAMDFRVKNYMALRDLQRALAMVVRPEVDAGGAGFRLSESDRALLTEAMGLSPRESENPVYDPDEYPDHYVKFFLPGLRRLLPQERIRIYNKIGQAYGFTTENSYVVDRGSGLAFFLAATIYTNDDGVLNDDAYEYDEVAAPFMADLGEAVARALRSR